MTGSTSNGITNARFCSAPATREGHAARSRRMVRALVMGATFAASASAWGDSATWTFGGDGTWQTLSNWNVGTSVPTTGQTATFAAFASAPGGPITVTITGSSVSVGTVIFNAGVTVPISLSATGSNAFTIGATNLNDGITLDAAAQDVSITTTTGQFRFGSVTTVNLNTGTGRTLTINAPLAGTSSTRDPRKTGVGTLVLGVGGVGSGSGVAVRVFQMTAGNLRFDFDGSLSGSTTTISFSGGTIMAGGASRSVSNAYALAGDLNFDGSNDLTLSGNGTLTASRKITTTPTDKSLTLSGAIAGSGFGITKAGAGTLVLAGANTYNSFTSIDAGTLAVRDSGAVGGTVFVGNGGTTGTAAAFLLTSTAGGQSIANTVSVNPGDGTNRTIGGANTSGTNTFTGLVQLDGSFGENRSANVTAAAGGTVAFNNVISGPGQNVTKVGGGIVVLSANNSYSGSTTVNAGTLLVNGNPTGGGVYTVKVNGTLGGTGNTGAAVTVEPGGALSPGASIGALTVASLSLQASGSDAADYIVEVDTTDGSESADRTRITGAGGATLGDGVNFPELRFVFTPASIATFSPGKAFVIVQNDNSSASVTGRFAGPAPISGVQSVLDGLLQYNVYYGTYTGSGTIYGGGTAADGNDVIVEFVSVPEPASAAGLAGAMMLLARRRRGR